MRHGGVTVIEWAKKLISVFSLVFPASNNDNRRHSYRDKKTPLIKYMALPLQTQPKSTSLSSAISTAIKPTLSAYGINEKKKKQTIPPPPVNYIDLPLKHNKPYIQVYLLVSQLPVMTIEI